MKKIIGLFSVFVFFCSFGWADVGIKGRMMSISDVVGVEDRPIVDIIFIVTLPSEHYKGWVESLEPLGNSYFFNIEDENEDVQLVLANEEGYYSRLLSPGNHAVCFMSKGVKERSLRYGTCVEVSLADDEIFQVNYDIGEFLGGHRIPCLEDKTCTKLKP